MSYRGDYRMQKYFASLPDSGFQDAESNSSGVGSAPSSDGQPEQSSPASVDGDISRSAELSRLEPLPVYREKRPLPLIKPRLYQRDRTSVLGRDRSSLAESDRSCLIGRDIQSSVTERDRSCLVATLGDDRPYYNNKKKDIINNNNNSAIVSRKDSSVSDVSTCSHDTAINLFTTPPLQIIAPAAPRVSMPRYTYSRDADGRVTSTAKANTNRRVRFAEAGPTLPDNGLDLEPVLSSETSRSSEVHQGIRPEPPLVESRASVHYTAAAVSTAPPHHTAYIAATQAADPSPHFSQPGAHNQRLTFSIDDFFNETDEVRNSYSRSQNMTSSGNQRSQSLPRQRDIFHAAPVPVLSSPSAAERPFTVLSQPQLSNSRTSVSFYDDRGRRNMQQPSRSSSIQNLSGGVRWAASRAPASTKYDSTMSSQQNQSAKQQNNIVVFDETQFDTLLDSVRLY